MVCQSCWDLRIQWQQGGCDGKEVYLNQAVASFVGGPLKDAVQARFEAVLGVSNSWSYARMVLADPAQRKGVPRGVDLRSLTEVKPGDLAVCPVVARRSVHHHRGPNGSGLFTAAAPLRGAAAAFASERVSRRSGRPTPSLKGRDGSAGGSAPDTEPTSRRSCP
jgi:hypothetical protein